MSRQLARPHIEAADITRHVLLRRRRVARFSAAPTTTVSRTTMAGELAPICPGFTTARSRPFVRSISRCAETGHRLAGLSVQRHQLIAGRNHQDASSPCRHSNTPGRGSAPAPRQIPARPRPSVNPQRLAGGGIDATIAPCSSRRYSTPPTSSGVISQLNSGRLPKFCAFHSQAILSLSRCRVDLVERRILCGPGIAAVKTPLSVSRAALRSGRKRQQERSGGG